MNDEAETTSTFDKPDSEQVDLPLNLTGGILNILLTSHDVTAVREASEALLNLTVTPPAQKFMELDGLRTLNEILQNDEDDNELMLEHAVQVVGNIASTEENYRNQILDTGVFKNLLKIIQRTDSVFLLRSLSKTLRTVCCHYSDSLPYLTSFDLKQPIIKLLSIDDTTILLNATLLLSCICNPDMCYMNRRSGPIFDKEPCRRLVELLDEQKFGSEVVSSTLFTLAMVSTLNRKQCELLITCDVIKSLNAVLELRLEDHHALELILTTVKNICLAAKPTDLDDLINYRLLSYPIQLFHKEHGGDLRKRYLLAVALKAVTKMATSQQMTRIVGFECIPLLVDILDDDDVDNTSCSLQALRNILDHDVKRTATLYHDILLDCNGVTKIRNLVDDLDLSPLVQEVAASISNEFPGKKKKTKGFSKLIASKFG